MEVRSPGWLHHGSGLQVAWRFGIGRYVSLYDAGLCPALSLRATHRGAMGRRSAVLHKE
jgi:hypothetical protein